MVLILVACKLFWATRTFALIIKIIDIQVIYLSIRLDYLNEKDKQKTINTHYELADSDKGFFRFIIWKSVIWFTNPALVFGRRHPPKESYGPLGRQALADRLLSLKPKEGLC
ncbi:MAG: hypothetical protein IMY70_02105 [Bacteroidetes bacterium]|nr:hypothetical protein [Bacteroidota bacterium]